MRRTSLLAILSFLLLCMQQQALVHPLAHLPPRMAHSERTELALPQAADACAECALLAAVSSAALGQPVAMHFPAQFVDRVGSTFNSRVADAPSYYSSRAPPFLA
jgi:hypothetical protein